MFDGYRGRLAAAGISLFFAALIGFFLGRLEIVSADDDNHKMGNGNYGSATESSNNQPESLIGSVGDPSTNPKKSANPKKRDEKDAKPHEIGDLVAQWMMAAGTFGILYFTWRGLVFVRATYRASKKTLKQSGRAVNAAKKQVEVATRIGEAQIRAFIDVPEIKVGDIFEDGKMIRVKKKQVRNHWVFKFKNTGHSTAYDVEARCRMFFCDSGIDTSLYPSEWTNWKIEKIGFIPSGGDRTANFYDWPVFVADYEPPEAFEDWLVNQIAFELSVTYHDEVSRSTGGGRRETFIKRFAYTNNPETIYEFKGADYAN